MVYSKDKKKLKKSFFSILTFGCDATRISYLKQLGFDVYSINKFGFTDSFVYQNDTKAFYPKDLNQLFSCCLLDHPETIELDLISSFLYEINRVTFPGAYFFINGNFKDEKVTKKFHSLCNDTFSFKNITKTNFQSNLVIKKPGTVFKHSDPNDILEYVVMAKLNNRADKNSTKLNLELVQKTKNEFLNKKKFIKNNPYGSKKKSSSKLNTMVKTLLEISDKSDTLPIMAVLNRTQNSLKDNGEEICVSGISLGLPNSGDGKEFLSNDNFDRLINGESFLSKLGNEEIESLLAQRVIQIDKSKGVRKQIPIINKEQNYKIVGRLGNFDLCKEFGIPSTLTEGMDSTTKLAIAAGIKALKNAKIPLLKTKENPLSIPKDMQKDTGIIYASSFPVLDTCVKSVSDYLVHRFTTNIFDEKSIKILKNEDKCDLNNQETKSFNKKDGYSFDRKFLFKLLVRANNQLAQISGAKGPNTFVNAACASSAQAVCIASDWIKTKRCKRVLIVSADNATSTELLPFIGSGFLALGATCTKDNIQEAAVPFDRRRSGLILGMGAIGILLEAKNESVSRGISPTIQLIHSQFSNSAYHGALLDKKHIATELDRFLKSVEQKIKISRSNLSRNLIYFSHETGTAKTGGCAFAESNALSYSFGKDYKNVLICSTKGFTGHPMGANAEDALAIASLRTGRVPPIPNYKVKDERLGDLNLSKGGKTTRNFVLRMAAGFGSQIVFLLYRKITNGNCKLI